MNYAVYLVFEEMSHRACSRAIERFIRRSHIAVWRWCQRMGSYEKMHKQFRLGRE